MTYVCVELLDNVCQEWAVLPTLLPPLTLEQATILGVGFWLICVVAAGMRHLGYTIRKG